MSRLGKVIAGAAVTAVFGLPLFWVLLTALKTPADFTGNVLGPPSAPTFENMLYVIRQTAFLRFFLNSVVVAVGSVIWTLALAAPAAYALSRFRFRGRRAVQVVLLFGLIVPVHITLLPLLKSFHYLGLYDSLLGLQLVYAAFGLALTIFILRNAFDGVPRELEDAAAIDGAGACRQFLFVALPAVRPTIAVAVIYNLVMNFNEFAFALTLLQSEKKLTLPLGIQAISADAYGQNTPVLAAAITLVAIPMLLVFICAQRHLIAGLTRGAVKG